MRALAWTALAGAALAGLLIGAAVRLAAAEGTVSRPSYTRYYDGRPLSDGFELLMVQSDGQAYATLARDPSLARPFEFDSRAEAAYRAQRPLLGYLAWVSSAGRSSAVAPTLAVLCVLGAGVAAAGLGALLVRRGAPAWPAAFVALLPGAYASLVEFGPELLAVGLTAWGLVAWWNTPRRRWLAIGLFTLACAARETSLLAVAAVAIVEAWPGRGRSRDLLPLLVPFGVVAAWDVFLRLRLGAWPFEARHERLEAPLQGLLHAGWAGSLLQPAAFSVLAIVAVWVLVRGRSDPLAVVVLANVGLGLLMGRLVWAHWENFSRVLLPLAAFGFVVVLGQLVEHDAADVVREAGP